MKSVKKLNRSKPPRPVSLERLRQVRGGDDPDLVVVPDPGPTDTGPK